MPYDEPIPDDDEIVVMTIAEWRDAVAQGAFNEYDGSGYFARDGKMDRSAWKVFGLAPLDATHVAWFNK